MLKRHFNLLEITTFAINSILGLGVFYLLLDVQNKYRIGSYILVSLVLIYIMDLVIGYIYGLLGTAYSKSAGEYAFVSRMIHPFIGFVLGWAIAFNLVARFSFYLRVLAKILTAKFSWLPDHIDSFEIGLVLIIVFLLILMASTRLLIKLQTATFFITMLFFLASMTFMIYQFDLSTLVSNLQPIAWKEILLVATVLFSMYQGFETVTYVGGEVKNPKRNIPVAIFIALTIIFLIYIIFASLIYGSFPLNEIAKVGELFALLPKSIADFLIAGIIILLMIKIPLGIYATSRFFYAWGKDKVLPEIFASLDKSKTLPWFSVTFIGLMLATIYLLNLPLISLATLAAFTTSITYMLMSLAALSLRFRRKHLYAKSTLRFKYDVVIILLALIISLLIMYNAAFVDVKTLLLVILWMSVGIAIYVFRRETHNLIEEVEKEMTIIRDKLYAHNPANLQEQ